MQATACFLSTHCLALSSPSLPQVVSCSLELCRPYRLTHTLSATCMYMGLSNSAIILQISFCSTMLGEFSEDFQWMVAGSPSTLTLRITWETLTHTLTVLCLWHTLSSFYVYSGTVIGPTFQFDTTHINYGTISYGETTYNITQLRMWAPQHSY